MGQLLWSVKTQDRVNGSSAVVGGRTFLAGCDSSLHIIDLKAGKETASLELGGPVAAAAAVRGEHLYVGTMSNQVLGINWKNQQVLWTFEPKKRSMPFYSSAAVTDKLVIIGSKDRKVYALNRKDGTPVWEFRTGGKVDSSPVVVGKRVYIPSMDGHLYVLDLDHGKQLQDLPLGQSITASPAVAEGRLILGTTDGVLYCLGKK
jgi:outer membrane protein assembly factor BamB